MCELCCAIETTFYADRRMNQRANWYERAELEILKSLVGEEKHDARWEAEDSIPSSGRVHVSGVPPEHQKVTFFNPSQLNNKNIYKGNL